MKRNSFALVLTLFFALMFSGTAFSNNTTVSPTELIIENEKLSDKEKADKLMDRLNDIKDMNFSEMPRSERKAVRKEVRKIKKSLADLGGGVYLSATAIIIILLIIIIIL